jgi:hypothetical protein
LDDARGQITSHRARATGAAQLYNSNEPLSLFELQEWLGHSSAESTRHYMKITPTKLAKSYQDADYLARNLWAIEVLIASLTACPTPGTPSCYGHVVSDRTCRVAFLERSQIQIGRFWPRENADSNST